MRARIPNLLLLLLLTACGGSERDAQAALMKRYRADLTANLKEVAAEQALFREDHHAYARDLSELRFQGASDVVVRITAANDQGWVAQAWMKSMPDSGCAISGGSGLGQRDLVTPGGKRLEKPGDQVCDW
jgi:hypothetical protein